LSFTVKPYHAAARLRSCSIQPCSVLSVSSSRNIEIQQLQETWFCPPTERQTATLRIKTRTRFAVSVIPYRQHYPPLFSKLGCRPRLNS
jgi:hypothetical protein